MKGTHDPSEGRNQRNYEEEKLKKKEKGERERAQ